MVTVETWVYKNRPVGGPTLITTPPIGAGREIRTVATTLEPLRMNVDDSVRLVRCMGCHRTGFQTPFNSKCPAMTPWLVIPTATELLEPVGTNRCRSNAP